MEPRRPEEVVPSQAAWMSWGPTPASSKASQQASTIRSLTSLSQCSPNLVHPIPTMATLSFMPGISTSSGPYRKALPVVVMDALHRVQPAEGHVQGHPHLNLFYVPVCHHTHDASPTLKVHHTDDQGRVQGGAQVVHGIGEEAGLLARKAGGLKVVLGMALGAYPLDGGLDGGAVAALDPVEAQVLGLLPVDGCSRGGGEGGSPGGRGHIQQAPPAKVMLVVREDSLGGQVPLHPSPGGHGRG